MTRLTASLVTPRILVVDDERQIHAAMRLRLGKDYELVFCSNAPEALKLLGTEKFDLCFADIHMPRMDGLVFIASTAEIDRNLGFVVLTAFDSDENLRRAIPLQVYDFIGKPLPARDGLEERIPDWIERTRRRRQEHALAERAGLISADLESARLEREVEVIASESARDALLQTAGLLTTIHAHLVGATTVLAARAKSDTTVTHLLRSLDEARKTAEAAVSVTEGFFDSGYGNRDLSPALVGTGLRHAVSIATRMTRAEETDKTVDCSSLEDHFPVRGLSGIDFLLMMVPAIGAGVSVAAAKSTVHVGAETLARIDRAPRDFRLKELLWLNRRHAVGSQPGVMITIASAGAPAFSRGEAEAWLRGDNTFLPSVTTRGLVGGIRKCKGMFGLAVAPPATSFLMVFALPLAKGDEFGQWNRP